MWYSINIYIEISEALFDTEILNKIRIHNQGHSQSHFKTVISKHHFNL